jgi:hypothetical protein
MYGMLGFELSRLFSHFYFHLFVCCYIDGRVCKPLCYRSSSMRSGSGFLKFVHLVELGNGFDVTGPQFVTASNKHLLGHYTKGSDETS